MRPNKRNTVGHLKEMIKDLPDNMLVMCDGSDHSYYLGSPEIVKASYDHKQCIYSEHWDDIPLEENEVVIEVLSISGR